MRAGSVQTRESESRENCGSAEQKLIIERSCLLLPLGQTEKAVVGDASLMTNFSIHSHCILIHFSCSFHQFCNAICRNFGYLKCVIRITNCQCLVSEYSEIVLILSFEI